MGIRVGTRSFVSDCLSRSNTLYGVWADTGSRVVSTTVCDNGTVGIYVSSGGFAEDCVAFNNANDGFSTSDGAVIRNCTAYSNAGNGFGVSWGITVTGCTAHSNAGHGFYFGSYCDIENNSARSNGTSPSIVGAGFLSPSGSVASTVRNNSARQNEIGFKVDGTNSLVAGNAAAASSTSNYQIAAGNRVAQIVLLTTNAAINGNSGGTSRSPPRAAIMHVASSIVKTSRSSCMLCALSAHGKVALPVRCVVTSNTGRRSMPRTSAASRLNELGSIQCKSSSTSTTGRRFDDASATAATASSMRLRQATASRWRTSASCPPGTSISRNTAATSSRRVSQSIVP